MPSKITNTFLFFFLLLSFVLSIAVSEPAGSEAHVYSSNLLPLLVFQTHELNEQGLWRSRNAGPRRLMIGSRVPLCTYNECRGCRFKCCPEQVPVDANDPINSPYHYRCVCHG
ncbi:hypothetical protein MUK42_08658 [Musa troglodytarum]|uniref:Stomagen C-terminal domain-containing protein n=1 Tax=Musa troglodytarum TaxID=320322 RepID=A0A9E7INF3_9LILI|nr:hypothetical protein MUK42_08658 [Musa troglodytarum]